MGDFLLNNLKVMTFGKSNYIKEIYLGNTQVLGPYDGEKYANTAFIYYLWKDIQFPRDYFVLSSESIYNYTSATGVYYLSFQNEADIAKFNRACKVIKLSYNHMNNTNSVIQVRDALTDKFLYSVSIKGSGSYNNTISLYNGETQVLTNRFSSASRFYIALNSKGIYCSDGDNEGKLDASTEDTLIKITIMGGPATITFPYERDGINMNQKYYDAYKVY